MAAEASGGNPEAKTGHTFGIADPVSTTRRATSANENLITHAGRYAKRTFIWPPRVGFPSHLLHRCLLARQFYRPGTNRKRLHIYQNLPRRQLYRGDEPFHRRKRKHSAGRC